jgi:hypothetical protein
VGVSPVPHGRFFCPCSSVVRSFMWKLAIRSWNFVRTPRRFRRLPRSVRVHVRHVLGRRERLIERRHAALQMRVIRRVDLRFSANAPIRLSSATFSVSSSVACTPALPPR